MVLESSVKSVAINRQQNIEEMLRAFKVKPQIEGVDISEIQGLLTHYPKDEEGPISFQFLELSGNADLEWCHIVCAMQNLRQDLGAQIQVNIDDPGFSAEHPNAACWLRPNVGSVDEYIVVSFYQCDGESIMKVSYAHRTDVIPPGWLIGGVPFKYKRHRPPIALRLRHLRKQ